MPEYDLVVIGSGPPARRGGPGGVLPQEGCGGRTAVTARRCRREHRDAPSKTLRETSLYLSGFRQRGLYGVDMQLEARTGVRELLFRERAVAQEEQVRVAQNLRAHGADVYQGKGRLAGREHRAGAPARSRGATHGKVILIATGSSPFHPPLFNFSAPGIYDSDSILSMSEDPTRWWCSAAGSSAASTPAPSPRSASR